MVTTNAALPFSQALAEHGEGPVWFHETQQLRFVDMLAGDILTLSHDGSFVARHHVGTVAAALRPRRKGGMIIAVERGFAVLSDNGVVTTLPEIWSDPSVRMNDGACDPRGRFFAGTMAYDAAPGRGSLYRLNEDGSTSTVLDGLTISNGLAFSPDGATAIFVDSATRQVRRYLVPDDDGEWSDFQVLVEISETLGTPDGLCLDSEGGVWVALWNGSAVHRYSPAGNLTDVVTLPVTQVTACTLGGPDGKTLYITTSALGIDRSLEPSAGAVFAREVKIPGLEPAPCVA